MSRRKTYRDKKLYVQTLINTMQDVFDLAVEHNLTGELHYGSQLTKVVSVLENHYQNQWYKLLATEAVAKPARWERMIQFLNEQLTVIQLRALECESSDSSSTRDKDDNDKRNKSKDDKPKPPGGGARPPKANLTKGGKCNLCGVSHPNPNSDFFNCKKFLGLSCKERGNLVRKLHFCLQCLSTKTKHYDPNHTCSDKWICKHESHASFQKKLHFFVCEVHKTEDENVTLFELFKLEVLTADWQKNVFKGNSTFVSRHATFIGKKLIEEKANNEENSEIEDKAQCGTPTFLLQPIPFNGHIFRLMFDNGAEGFISRKGAVDLLPDKCKENIMPGPLKIKGVGDTLVNVQHGYWSVKLPIHNGKLAKFSGMCMEVITGKMPAYPVREARKEIVKEYVAQGGKESDLPQVPVLAGGETDFLFGQQYNYFAPRLLFILSSGLAIYESMFKGVDGTRGCLGGPSKLFEQAEKQFLEANPACNFRVFLQQTLSLFANGIKICVDVDSLASDNMPFHPKITVIDEDEEDAAPVTLLSLKESTPTETASDTEPEYRCQKCYGCADCKKLMVMLSSKSKVVTEADEAGTNIDYRCEKCRGCSDCKRGEHIQKVSFKEEFEQHLVRESVRVDLKKKETTALLPFIADPVTKLCSNEAESLKVYYQQLKLIAKKPGARQALLDTEMALQEANYVEWVKNLSESERLILIACLQVYFLPWTFVFNENSVTTPMRIVFNASAVTKSGYSLNDLLAKGIKSLNPLQQIFIAFRCRIIAIHTDLKKMYNTIKLRPEHWTYQRYWWHPTLDPNEPPEPKTVKTIIYGVTSSGNQAEYALRETARLQAEKYPEAANSLINDTYMDDVLTGADDEESAEKLMDDINSLIPNGGFSSKGFTVSGKPPLPHLSKDGSTIMTLGTRYFPETDELQLAYGPLNFAKKHRGKRVTTPDSHEVPDKLTKSICLSKLAELFDVCGLAAPIVCGVKLDMDEIVMSECNWKDKIPDSLRGEWLTNFKLLEGVGQLKYSRIVIPSDAESLTMDIIGTGDASAKMTCAACYVRFKRKNGDYSCQLMLSKTKIVHTTLPRAELVAATLNVHVTEIVKRSVESFRTISGCIYVLDSEIVLHWICSMVKQLKPFVRNRVLEILRFSYPAMWYHVASKLNPADLGTRKGAKLEDINAESDWINGKEWMRLPVPEMVETVLRTVEDVKCDNQQSAEINKERMKPVEDLCNSQFNLVMDATQNDVDTSPRCYMIDVSKSEEFETTFPAKVRERLSFSKYLIDPNRFNFNRVVRILAIVIKVAKIWYAANSRTGRESKTIARFSATAVVNEKATKSIVEHKSISEKRVMQDFVILSDEEVQYALNYFFMKASEEVKSFVHPKNYQNISVERNNILYFTGRVPLENLTFKCKMTDTMLDLSTGTFIVPLVEKYSPLSFSVMNQIHWYDSTAKHSGIETTIRSTMTVAHILGVRDVAKLFRKNCVRCRFLLMKTVDVEMGQLPSSRLCVAPPYYYTQVDIAGHFTAYSKHNKRTSLKVWIIVYVCATTGMTNLKIMEGYDTTQFLLTFSRFACEAGYPKYLLADKGSQLISGSENMMINMSDVGGNLNREYGIRFEVCPVGGHNFHGKVERKIRTVKETLRDSVHNARLSTIEWETLCAEMANSINNLPVVIGNETSELENLDLITPNRLRLSRNNSRSPIGVVELTDRFDRILQINSDIFNAWWEAWLTSAVPKLVPQPKWFRNDEDIKVGDVVLFKRTEGSLAGEYKYGMVDEVHRGPDDRIRSVVLRYKNASEEIERKTVRAVRSLVIVHRIDEINIMEELGKTTFTDVIPL